MAITAGGDKDRDSTTLTVSTALGGTGANSQRRFAGHKISKVRFLADLEENTGRFVSGSWNLRAPSQGRLTLWQTDGGERGQGLERKEVLALGEGLDVEDIFVVNRQQIVCSLSNGHISIVDCPVANSAEGEADRKMCQMASYPAVHRQAASTALCVLDNEIFSGSDSGQIVRIQPASRASHAVHSFAEDLMGVTGLCTCGQSLLLSAHSTGQLHFWDVRKRAISPEFGIEPLNSRPVTGLNNSITAVAAHPSQQNVIGFGTRDGVVSFVDIRQTGQPLPIAFKVSQEPIHELKFHPAFANNCFSLSDSSLIHWDGSLLARESGAINGGGDCSGGVDGQQQREADLMDLEADGASQNIWLSARASTSMQLRVLVEEEPRLLSSFDIVQGSLVAGSHTAELLLLTGANFSN